MHAPSDSWPHVRCGNKQLANAKNKCTSIIFSNNIIGPAPRAYFATYPNIPPARGYIAMKYQEHWYRKPAMCLFIPLVRAWRSQ